MQLQHIWFLQHPAAKAHAAENDLAAITIFYAPAIGV
jgi:hypothetical protein